MLREQVGGEGSANYSTHLDLEISHSAWLRKHLGLDLLHSTLRNNAPIAVEDLPGKDVGERAFAEEEWPSCTVFRETPRRALIGDAIWWSVVFVSVRGAQVQKLISQASAESPPDFGNTYMNELSRTPREKAS